MVKLKMKAVKYSVSSSNTYLLRALIVRKSFQTELKCYPWSAPSEPCFAKTATVC